MFWRPASLRILSRSSCAKLRFWIIRMIYVDYYLWYRVLCSGQHIWISARFSFSTLAVRCAIMSFQKCVLMLFSCLPIFSHVFFHFGQDIGVGLVGSWMCSLMWPLEEKGLAMPLSCKCVTYPNLTLRWILRFGHYKTGFHVAGFSIGTIFGRNLDVAHSANAGQ